MKNTPIIFDSEDLYQNAPFGYMSVRQDGLIVNINATLLRWLGYERNEVILQKFFQDFLGMGGKIYFETHIMPLLRIQGKVSEVNMEFKTKGSIKLPTLINATHIPSDSIFDPIYRFSVLDITKRTQYESELKKAREKAEHTVDRLKQVNQELEQFAYTASHDLQAPLNTISGLMNLLDHDGYFPEGSEGKEYFSLIQSNTQRMKLMIRDLLEYSKIDANEIEFETISLNDVCENALEMIEEQVSMNKATFIIPELPKIQGAKLQMVRLFQNLFANAIKYRGTKDPVVKVEFEEKSDELTIFVKDNGMGFEMKHAEHVFGFMKRLHSNDSIPGTGIGLSTCKRILEIHRGTIGAESELGKGSTFYFTLPRYLEKPTG